MHIDYIRNSNELYNEDVEFTPELHIYSEKTKMFQTNFFLQNDVVFENIRNFIMKHKTLNKINL